MFIRSEKTDLFAHEVLDIEIQADGWRIMNIFARQYLMHCLLCFIAHGTADDQVDTAFLRVFQIHFCVFPIPNPKPTCRIAVISKFCATSA